jgi:hypothetical protein
MEDLHNMIKAVDPFLATTFKDLKENIRSTSNACFDASKQLSRGLEVDLVRTWYACS